MRGPNRWLALGLRHPLWDLHRYYLSLARKGGKYQQEWLQALRRSHAIKVEDRAELPIDPGTIELFFEYSSERETQFLHAEANLRTEEEALAFCNQINIEVGHTATQNMDHHQSSKSMIAAVSSIARQVCQSAGLTVDDDPQTRCVWCGDHNLHVSARNLDGAIPSLVNPFVVWEIKEYWGKTKGGSKMSDAVYECHLVGLELRDYEARGGQRVTHIVFIDGKEQWGARKSDLRRLLDLMNQGLVDHLIIGHQVESEWHSTLESLIQ